MPEKLPVWKGPNPLMVRLTLLSFGRLNMWDFVSGTISHAKSPLHWSVRHFQVTFE